MLDSQNLPGARGGISVWRSEKDRAMVVQAWSLELRQWHSAVEPRTRPGEGDNVVHDVRQTLARMQRSRPGELVPITLRLNDPGAPLGASALRTIVVGPKPNVRGQRFLPLWHGLVTAL